MSKQSRQKLMNLLGFLIVIGLLVTACGSPEPATPAPTVMSIPTMSKTETQFSWGEYVFAADKLESVVGKTNADKFDIMSLKINDQQYTLKSKIFNDGNNNIKLWINLHEVNGASAGKTNDFTCYRYNGHSEALTSNWNDIGHFDLEQQLSVFCPINDSTTLYMWVWIRIPDQIMKELLTGTPATSGQQITATTITTTMMTPSPTTTLPAGTNVTPSITLSVTPTSNGQPTREVHCPAEDPHQSNTQVKFDSVNYQVTITSTLCWHYEVGGVKSYGAYLGKKDGYDRWTWTYTMDQKTGMIKGFAVDPNTVTDFDKCWKANYAGGFLYIQCPRPATATPTITYTPTATATKTSTPTFAGTATAKP